MRGAMIARTLNMAALLATLIVTAAIAQQPASDTTPSQQTRRTTALGTRTQEFLLSKITVSDLPKSYEFYTKIVGLKWALSPGQAPPPPPSGTDPETDFREIPLNFTGSLADPFFVLVARRGAKPVPEHAKMTTIGFKVPNIRDAIARAVAAGYQTTGRPPGDGSMAFGFVLDPDGYQIEFIQAPFFPPN